MSRNVIFLEDVFGEGWQGEIGDDAGIEPCEKTVRGLTSGRYRQLWRLYPDAPHNGVLQHLGAGITLGKTAEASGLSERQVKNLIAQFIKNAGRALAQQTFLPEVVATNLYLERRPRSRRGRPPKSRAPAPESRQAALPF